jgi:hypothetical protein
MQKFPSLVLACSPQTVPLLSAHDTLRTALASVDEATLAAYLRVSLPTLRRYASGELNMNWVICTRLSVMPTVQAAKAELPTTSERYRASLERRRERRATKRQEEPALAGV